jgi:hypothetical protein
MRALIILGAAIDILLALFLLLVFGWIIDSWHDPKGAWVGVSVTAMWLIAVVALAGAPLLAWRQRRRGASRERAALIVWTPSIALVGITIIGFMIAPP